MDASEVRVGRIFRSTASAGYKKDEFRWKVIPPTSNAPHRVRFEVIKSPEATQVGICHESSMEDFLTLFDKIVEWAEDEKLAQPIIFTVSNLSATEIAPIDNPYPPEFWQKYTGRKSVQK